MKRGCWIALGAILLAGIVSGAALAVTRTSDSSAKGTPIVIGAAIDETNFMSYFNLPALTAAKLEAAKINAKGGVLGHPLVFQDGDTTLDPGQTKSVAQDLISKGAKIMWVTCDVDYATPAVQEALKQGMLAIAPCIGTDQMGPKRFGAQGNLAFSFGNVAQDEGAALAQMAWKQGFRSATVVTDKVLYYTQSVCKAFTARFQKLGGKITLEESFTQGDKTIGNVVTSVNSKKTNAIAICTVTQADLPSFVSGLRSLGNNTPIISPWSADGTFWLPKSPAVSNFYVVTFASIYGDDPSKAVKALQAQMTGKNAPTTGGFVTGASAIDALAYAIKKNGGSTNGAKLAATLQKLRNFPTISGPISFSAKYHTVFGRTYRVIKITNGKAKLIGTIKAGTPQDIG